MKQKVWNCENKDNAKINILQKKIICFDSIHLVNNIDNENIMKKSLNSSRATPFDEITYILIWDKRIDQPIGSSKIIQILIRETYVKSDTTYLLPLSYQE